MTRLALALLVALTPVPVWAQAALPQPDYVSWREPVEGSFTVDVPRGWLVAGALIRRPGDTRQVIEMRAPDGTIEIGMGDPALPFFELPTAMSEQIGMHPGMRVDNLNVLAAYETGEAFAQDYGSLVFGRACGRPVALTGHQSFGTTQGAIPGIPNSSAASGAAMFRCDAPDHPFTAVTIGITELMPFAGMEGGTWVVPVVARAAAAKGADTPATRAIVDHVLRSFRLDPGWNARESAAQVAASRASMAATPTPSSAPSGEESVADYRRRIMNKGFEERAHASDEAAKNFSAYVGDNVRLRDPTTGAEVLAPTGSDVYVQGADGRITGHSATETLDGSGTTLQPIP